MGEVVTHDKMDVTTRLMSTSQRPLPSCDIVMTHFITTSVLGKRSSSEVFDHLPPTPPSRLWADLHNRPVFTFRRQEQGPSLNYVRMRDEESEWVAGYRPPDLKKPLQPLHAVVRSAQVTMPHVSLPNPSVGAASTGSSANSVTTLATNAIQHSECQFKGRENSMRETLPPMEHSDNLEPVAKRSCRLPFLDTQSFSVRPSFCGQWPDRGNGKGKRREPPITDAEMANPLGLRTCLEYLPPLDFSGCPKRFFNAGVQYNQPSVSTHAPDSGPSASEKATAFFRGRFAFEAPLTEPIFVQKYCIQEEAPTGPIRSKTLVTEGLRINGKAPTKSMPLKPIVTEDNSVSRDVIDHPPSATISAREWSENRLGDFKEKEIQEGSEHFIKANKPKVSRKHHGGFPYLDTRKEKKLDTSSVRRGYSLKESVSDFSKTEMRSISLCLARSRGSPVRREKPEAFAASQECRQEREASREIVEDRKDFSDSPRMKVGIPSRHRAVKTEHTKKEKDKPKIVMASPSNDDDPFALPGMFSLSSFSSCSHLILLKSVT